MTKFKAQIENYSIFLLVNTQFVTCLLSVKFCQTALIICHCQDPNGIFLCHVTLDRLWSGQLEVVLHLANCEMTDSSLDIIESLRKERK